MTTGGHRKKVATCKPKREVFPLDLGLLTSRATRNTLLAFKPQPPPPRQPVGFCHGSPSRLTQHTEGLTQLGARSAHELALVTCVILVHVRARGPVGAGGGMDSLDTHI